MCTTDFCNDLDFDIHSGRAVPVLQLPGNSSRAAEGADLRAGGGGAISAFLERQQELRDNGSYSLLQHLQEEEELLLLDEEVGEEEEEEEGWGGVGHGVGAEEQRADRVPRQVAQGRKCD